MQNSKVEWCDHTFNPWHGCIEVSPGCTNCYARTLNHRYGFDNWGPAKTTPRRMMSENYWKQPIKWNEQARQAGKRARVFCASMADVFEDHPQLIEPRQRLFDLIEQTWHLEWLLLTKRPENMTTMAPSTWHNSWPFNVWAMTSVENQEQAEKRIPHLLKVPVAIRGLSCEPLLGQLDLWRWLVDVVPDPLDGSDDWAPAEDGIRWIIGGGESGHEARYCDLQWARSLRDQCQAASVAFFWKQWGEYVPKSQAPEGCPEPSVGPRGRRSAQAFAGLLGEAANDRTYWRVGKHAAGNLLDGRQWLEFPS